jgi:hypothetical protein
MSRLVSIPSIKRLTAKSRQGTFYIVINPDSFSHLCEYSNDRIDGLSASYKQESHASSLIEAASEGAPSSAENPDLNTVI